jgi:short subunit dehydrogenase-like uncharacterized protein
MNNFLIYGANGYTGRLIVDRALELGFKPIIAGRNAKDITALAEEKELEFRIFSLDDSNEIKKQLNGIALVIHCAGPFVHTAKNMAKACIHRSVHYLDITGEIAVFEMLQTLDTEAKVAGVMLLPGTGFDVVPSDCLAAMLKEKMPEANKLEMAFTGLGVGVSHGTAATAVENLGKANLIRENGIIKEVPMGKLFKWVEFGPVKHHCISIPWGDVSTAFVSTGIPNITVYMGMPASMRKWMLLGNWIKPILRSNFVKKRLRKRLDKMPAGPNTEQRKNGKSYFWGEASDASGNKVSLRLQTSEGYTLTAISAVHIATKVLNGNLKTGFQTPSGAYGSGLVLEVEGSSMIYL